MVATTTYIMTEADTCRELVATEWGGKPHVICE